MIAPPPVSCPLTKQLNKWRRVIYHCRADEGSREDVLQLNVRGRHQKKKSRPISDFALISLCSETAKGLDNLFVAVILLIYRVKFANTSLPLHYLATHKWFGHWRRNEIKLRMMSLGCTVMQYTESPPKQQYPTSLRDHTASFSLNLCWNREAPAGRGGKKPAPLSLLSHACLWHFEFILFRQLCLQKVPHGLIYVAWKPPVRRLWTHCLLLQPSRFGPDSFSPGSTEEAAGWFIIGNQLYAQAAKCYL